MQYVEHLLVVVEIYGLLAYGLGLIVGYCGVPALGHAAFFGIGAYTYAIACTRFGFVWYLALVMSGVVAGLCGAASTLPSRRLKGDILALSTFGMGIVVYSIMVNANGLTGGPSGLPNLPGVTIGERNASILEYAILGAAILGIYILATYYIVKSHFGLIVQAIREDPLLVLCSGREVNVYVATIMGFGTFGAGIGGGLYAAYMSYISPSTFDISQSLFLLIMIVLGGLGHLMGPAIGLVALIGVPEILRNVNVGPGLKGPLEQMLFALILITIVRFRPRGVVGRFYFRG